MVVVNERALSDKEGDMGLFKPAWMTDKEKNLPKALVAVEQMTGQGELTQVAIGAPLAVVAEAAVDKVADRDCLVEIAMGAACESARIAAMIASDSGLYTTG